MFVSSWFVLTFVKVLPVRSDAEFFAIGPAVMKAMQRSMDPLSGVI